MAIPIAYGADWSARHIYGDTLVQFRYTDGAGSKHPLSVVLRYADFPGQQHAVLTADEYRSHLEVGIRSYLIYQRTTRDPDGGAARGKAFGEAAVAYAKHIGYRQGNPIFFTADAPIGSYHIDTAMKFFEAATEVVRRAGFLGGVYGFRDVIWAAQDRGIGDVYWLCGAESGWRAGIQLYQWNNGRIYPGGVEADLVKQFEPIEGDDMTLEELMSAQIKVRGPNGEVVREVDFATILEWLGNEFDSTRAGVADVLEAISNDPGNNVQISDEQLAKLRTGVSSDLAGEITGGFAAMEAAIARQTEFLATKFEGLDKNDVKAALNEWYGVRVTSDSTSRGGL